MTALGTNPESATPPDDVTFDVLATSPPSVAVQDEASQTEAVNPEKSSTTSRHMRIYTRPQLLFLYRSPLVRPPPDMPELKDWFGSENEQNLSKKESEPATPSSARERRFRRDAEDGETPSRPSFRSTLSQPSQMGNFKHQSLRASDRERERDRERDGDKDRERDIRDKEGQERLRHLSDKYDRDRLASPLTGLRKERDAAPHLSSGSTSRLGSQAQGTSIPSRRAENREAAKKKAGEASEDWRRGAEPRSAREERTDGGRKDRDERARSRVRDTSRSRREPSTTRRERDREERDRPRDRDDHRRERERDADRDAEDDARRWRDDGKRDERIAAKRGDRHQDQYRERERGRDKDSAQDAGDRRWVAVEERDGRSKRASGRERKSGPLADDGKDRDDRRDREREREPAWMDTYIPTSSSAGILGGKGAEGELDGIQAWKKERKEKELKDKGASANGDGIEVQEMSTEKSEGDARQLDEIQLFRLMMKREGEKKNTDTQDNIVRTSSPASGVVVPTEKARPPQPATTSLNDAPAMSSPSVGQSQTSQIAQTPVLLSQAELHPLSTPAPSHSLLSILGAKESITMNASVSSDFLSNDSRTPPSSTVVNSHPIQENPLPNIERLALDSTPPQFNPPPGSRLLAFARTSSAATKPPVTNNIQNGTFNVGNVQPESTGQIPPKSDALRSKPGFSPFEEPLRPSYLLEEHRESSNFIMTSDIHRRGSAERSSFSSSTETSAFQDSSPSLENGVGYSATKGSRFAKFFDGKGREGLPPAGKIVPPGGIASSSPSPGGQRQEHAIFNNGIHGGPDPRAMDEIYAMLSSSAQGPRGTTGHIQGSAPLSNNGSFGLQAQNNLHLLQQQQLHHQQQQQQQQQQIHASRLEPLYDSRLDDRNFVPDGMVPGLRSAPPPRTRENIGLYPEGLDEGLHFNVQRLPPQQQRGLDQLYPGAPPALFPQQGGRNTNIPIQQHYRGGHSPLSHQQNILPTSQQQQRLPPGLANLGGRPPHEPSQFLGMPGMPTPGLHGALHLNGSVQQQQFNNFPPGYGGAPPMRGPHPLQNHGVHHPMGGMGHPTNMDLRAANQNQLLGLSGVGGLRGAGGGFSGQQGPAAQIPGSLLTMRQQQQQQQQQQLPPHMMPHLLPPHLQQQGLSGPNSQPTHDLMALLMGGAHRE